MVLFKLVDKGNWLKVPTAYLTHIYKVQLLINSLFQIKSSLSEEIVQLDLKLSEEKKSSEVLVAEKVLYLCTCVCRYV